MIEKSEGYKRDEKTGDPLADRTLGLTLVLPLICRLCILLLPPLLRTWRIFLFKWGMSRLL